DVSGSIVPIAASGSVQVNGGIGSRRTDQPRADLGTGEIAFGAPAISRQRIDMGDASASIWIDFAQLRLQELLAPLCRRVEPAPQRLAVTGVEIGNQVVHLLSKPKERAFEVVAVVQEDVAPQRPVAAGDARGVEESFAG